jgi:hypothetical protein
VTSKHGYERRLHGVIDRHHGRVRRREHERRHRQRPVFPTRADVNARQKHHEPANQEEPAEKRQTLDGVIVPRERFSALPRRLRVRRIDEEQCKRARGEDSDQREQGPGEPDLRGTGGCS